MKKLIKVTSLILTLALLFTSCNRNSTQSSSNSSSSSTTLLDRIEERGSINIGTEGTWAPWTYHDESDNLVGFDIDVAREVASIMGVDPVFFEGEWDGLFAGLNSSRYDIIANGVEVTDERAETYDFSVPYAYINTVIIVRDDNTDINSFEDLDGKTTANTLSSTYAELAESYGAHTIGVDALADTILLLEQGRVDATLNSSVSYYDYMSVHPEAKLKIAASTDSPSLIAIPVRKGNPELLSAINSAIEELRENGKLSEISVKYFNADLTNR